MRTIYKDGISAICEDAQLKLMLNRGWSTENGTSNGNGKSPNEEVPISPSEEGTSQKVERVLIKRVASSNDVQNSPRVVRSSSTGAQSSNATTVRRVAK